MILDPKDTETRLIQLLTSVADGGNAGMVLDEILDMLEAAYNDGKEEMRMNKEIENNKLH